MKPKKAIKGVILSVVFLSVIFLGLQKAWELAKDRSFLGNISGSAEIVQPEAKEEPRPSLPYRNWNIPELDLAAESGLVVETSFSGSDKILFNKNCHTKLPIASLTKLMTAVISFENYDLSKTIKVSEEAVLQDGEFGKIELNKEVTVNDLLYIMLIQSSNHAAFILSEGMEGFEFVRLMNEKARELEMDGTFFVEPTGLSAENVSTASDLVKLAKYILANHPKISEISRIKEYDLPGYGVLTNTDDLLEEIPEIIAGKTGFTLEAKGCLLLLLDNSEKNSFLINVVLGADDRFEEMKKMIEWVNTAYNW